MSTNKRPSESDSTGSAPKHANSDYFWQFEQLNNEVNNELLKNYC